MKKHILFSLMFLLIAGYGWSQCENWNDLPNKSSIEDAHVIYRQEIKSKNYEGAFENWKIAFEAAPTADGRRDFHYSDGIAIYTYFYKNTEDETKKEAYRKKIIDLYNGMINCYESRAIEVKDCDDDCYNSKIGMLYGRLGYEMFYTFNAPYTENLEVLQKSIDLLGNISEYIILEPLARIAVYNFQNKKMTKDEVRALEAKLSQVADFNIEEAGDYAQYYETTKKRVNNVFKTIERDIYDCQYFVDKYKPLYEENKTNFDMMKRIYADLSRQGCSNTEPFMVEVKRQYETLASTMNAAKLAEWEAKNPASIAKKAYDAGDYDTAVAKYTEAANKQDDPNRKAEYYFRIASIQFRKQKKYGAARATALKAAGLRANWGKPYMLIGDMYATTSRNCGDSWMQRLAVLAAIDKYAHAKNIDPSVGVQAGQRINRYNNSRPAKEDAFMQGLQAGQSVKVGCWIGETVKLRF